jgi:spore coat protein U-like protein
MLIWPLEAIVALMRKRRLFVFVSALAIACATQPAIAAFSCGAPNWNGGVVFNSVNVSSGSAIYITGTLTQSCTGASSGRTYVFCDNLPAGPHATGNQRRMISGSNYLNFSLFTDSGHTVQWGNWSGYLSGGDQASFASSGTTVNQSVTIYARIDAAQQSAAAGSYSETLPAGVPTGDVQYGSTSGSCPTGSSTQAVSLTITATVTAVCTIGAATLNFGTWTGAQVIGSITENSSSFTVTCTNGSAYAIGMSNGNYASGSQRRMANGSNYISYNLYTDAGYSNPWGTAANGTTCTTSGQCILGTGTGSAQSINVYGKVPATGTFPAAGVYSDTVVMTVMY